VSRLPTLLAILLLLACGQSAMALDDPMRPPTASTVRSSTSTGSGYTLSSTFIARDRKSAIINGRQVSVGDRIDGARVLEIMPTQVQLQAQGRTVTVLLLPIAVKKPAKVE